MLIIRKYKKSRSWRALWEYKIVFRDPYSHKVRERRRRGFNSKKEAEIAAAEMLAYLGIEKESHEFKRD